MDTTTKFYSRVIKESLQSSSQHTVPSHSPLISRIKALFTPTAGVNPKKDRPDSTSVNDPGSAATDQEGPPQTCPSSDSRESPRHPSTWRALIHSEPIVHPSTRPRSSTHAASAPSNGRGAATGGPWSGGAEGRKERKKERRE
jgi:hypothetical protein